MTFPAGEKKERANKCRLLLLKCSEFSLLLKHERNKYAGGNSGGPDVFSIEFQNENAAGAKILSDDAMNKKN